MSTPPPTRDHRSSSATEDNPAVQPATHGVLERALPTFAHLIRVTCFWTAIVLPVLYIPLLVTGLTTRAETATFLGLLGMNLLTLYVGHPYRR